MPAVQNKLRLSECACVSVHAGLYVWKFETTNYILCCVTAQMAAFAHFTSLTIANQVKHIISLQCFAQNVVN